MEEGERSPLLSQGTGCWEEPLPGSSRSGLAPQEDQVRRAGPGGDPASSLPWESSCLKYLTFLSNFLFSLLGLLALAIGLWGLAVKGSLGSSGGTALPEDPLLGLALGGLAVSAVSLAGCLGALCENACLLHCFSGGLIAFLALEAVVGALLVAFWGPLQDGLESTLRAAITHYQDDPDLHFLIDQVQLGLQCCGVSSYRDWTWNLDLNCSSPEAQACSLPASCCLSPGEDGGAANDPCGFRAPGLDEGAAPRRVHLVGCGPPLRWWLRAKVRGAGAYAIAVVAVQGVELLLAARLVQALAVRQGMVESPRTAGSQRSSAQLAQA
ncbi:tetraspanin-10 isoform X3 [Ailuropoda melanoleuca]|uniref:tetraspanin-10 isoform X3 n=1 Tax=Ailuropoda melanoleuca TaxID=9646 RepID=UPI00059B26F3|nr:tetraspanin-10 isoform X3 [Ailuropoda melanoleuca]